MGSRRGPACALEGASCRALAHFRPLACSGSVSLGNVLPSADIAQFKQGVKSVAGKMAVLANGVMNSLQVRLGLLALGGGEGEGLEVCFLPMF